jgi:hypothetical protein
MALPASHTIVLCGDGESGGDTPEAALAGVSRVAMVFNPSGGVVRGAAGRVQLLLLAGFRAGTQQCRARGHVDREPQPLASPLPRCCIAMSRNVPQITSKLTAVCLDNWAGARLL